MTLKQLKAFFWAAKLGNFAIAADRLSISQSSLSKRIAELEQDLKAPLFDRSARRAVVTDAGEVLLAGAQQMLALEADIRNRISRRNEVVGTLHLAMGELSAATWFPRFLKRVAAVHPDLVVEPTVSQARSMELNVERGELDCAIIAGVPTRATLAAQSLGSIRFAWMAAPSLVDGFETPPGLAELLTRHPLIAPNSLSGQLQGFADWMTAAGVAMDRVIRCNSLNAIVELTCAGAGVSLLPRQYLMPIITRGLMVEISSGATEPTLQYSFIWRRDDLRVLTARARDLVSEEVDFDIPSQLWQIGAASSPDGSLLAIQ